jgi:hypothetical protein
LALQFDQSNPVNQFIKEVLLDEVFHQENFNIHEKDKINWQDTENGLTRKDLVGINALLFLNKTNINNALPSIVQERTEVAKTFWETVLKIDGLIGESPRQNTVAAQPVVLKALAKLFFDFFFGKNPDWVTKENQDKLIKGVLQVNFSHNNPMWQFYTLTQAELIENKLESLREYLPIENEGNRDLGNFTNNEFRFGAKHNDIHPLIGDMIRWTLQLPKRRKESVQASMEV